VIRKHRKPAEGCPVVSSDICDVNDGFFEAEEQKGAEFANSKGSVWEI
jgi:hypothetical protein